MFAWKCMEMRTHASSWNFDGVKAVSNVHLSRKHGLQVQHRRVFCKKFFRNAESLLVWSAVYGDLGAMRSLRPLCKSREAVRVWKLLTCTISPSKNMQELWALTHFLPFPPGSFIFHHFPMCFFPPKGRFSYVQLLQPWLEVAALVQSSPLVSVVLSDLFGTKVRDVPDVPVISCDRSIPNHAKIDIGSDKPAI